MILFYFIFILFQSRTGVDLFYFPLFYLGRDGSYGVLDFYFGVFSVDRSFSVRPNLGRVGFSCGNREKLSVLTLNKLGFVNDVEGFVGWQRR